MCDNHTAAPISLGYISSLLDATLKSTPDGDHAGDNSDDTAARRQKKPRKVVDSKKLESMLGEYAFLFYSASTVFEESSGFSVIGF